MIGDDDDAIDDDDARTEVLEKRVREKWTDREEDGWRQQWSRIVVLRFLFSFSSFYPLQPSLIPGGGANAA